MIHILSFPASSDLSSESKSVFIPGPIYKVKISNVFTPGNINGISIAGATAITSGLGLFKIEEIFISGTKPDGSSHRIQFNHKTTICPFPVVVDFGFFMTDVLIQITVSHTFESFQITDGSANIMICTNESKIDTSYTVSATPKTLTSGTTILAFNRLLKQLDIKSDSDNTAVVTVTINSDLNAPFNYGESFEIPAGEVRTIYGAFGSVKVVATVSSVIEYMGITL